MMLQQICFIKFLNSFKHIFLSNIHCLYIYIAANFKIHRVLKHRGNICVNSSIECYVRIPCLHRTVKEELSFLPSAFSYVLSVFDLSLSVSTCFVRFSTSMYSMWQNLKVCMTQQKSVSILNMIQTALIYVCNAI